jgi:hypothetical protein
VKTNASRRKLANFLAPFTTRVLANGHRPLHVVGLDNRVADAVVTRELAAIMATSPDLRRLAQRLNDSSGRQKQREATTDVQRALDAALLARPELVETLWPLLAPSIEADGSERRGAGSVSLRLRDAVERVGASILMAASIAVVVLVAVWVGDRHLGALGVIDLAVIGILSFLPGWLYVRFIGQRAGAVWQEFVLNLHRLGLDKPQYLPEPPLNSVYHDRWSAGRGETMQGYDNIYQQKFDAYYGRSVSSAGQDYRLKSETLFPIVLATVTFAIGWTALLWNGGLADAGTTLEPLAAGFLGAYLFDIQMLTRRFFQSDLKPSAYASAVLRVVVVVIIVLAMHQLPLFADGNNAQEEAVVAFVVGLFPLVGLQALNRLVAVILRRPVPTLQSKYPLSDLEGLTVWYEARLLEEGIEDMQNLVSANMVEVLLHTRVPVGRLVDWHDQALLYLHLRPRRDERKKGREHPRDVLASFGVRSATSFLKAFPIDPTGGQWADPEVEPFLEECVDGGTPDLSPARVKRIARILSHEPALEPVRNWQGWRDGPAGAAPPLPPPPPPPPPPLPPSPPAPPSSSAADRGIARLEFHDTAPSSNGD